ncbi:MAG: radical SAM protein [Candidatus Scalindua sp.]|nr:radical SAM protein [Candidatus Scalindua sp.]
MKTKNGPFVELLFPPTWNVFGSPHLALPLLKGFLEKVDIPTQVIDINLMVVLDFFSRKHLERVEEELRYRITVCKTENHQNSALYNELVIALDLVLFAIPRIDEAQMRFRTQAQVEYLTLFQICSRAISALFFPTLWSIRHSAYETGCTHRSPTLKNAIKMANTDDENIFARYFRHAVLKRLSQHNHRVVGISMVTEGQVIPAFTLARIVREAYPSVCIVVGGSTIPYLWDALPMCPEVFDIVDAVVVGPGEYSLKEIINRYYEGRSFEDIPNTKFRNNNGKVVGKRGSLPEGSSLEEYLPDFSDLPLDDYLMAHRILPVRMADRCYWNRCSFCSRANAEGLKYQPKRIKQVVEDLKVLSDRYGPCHFDFIDEAISLYTLDKLANVILSEGVNMTWQCLSRFDAQLDHSMFERIFRSGCRYIRWGMESASQRVADHMQKGIFSSNAEKLLRQSHGAGIYNHVFFIVGFPAETESDFDETIRFLETTSEYIDSVGLSTFLVERFSDIAKRPDLYNLVLDEKNIDSLFTKVIKVIEGNVPPSEINIRKLKFYDVIMKTHIGTNYINPLPFSWLITLLIREGKQIFRNRQRAMVQQWLHRFSYKRKSRNAVRMKNTIWLGKSRILKIKGNTYSFKTVIVPKVSKVFTIEEGLIDFLKTPEGVSLELLLNTNRWQLSESVNSMQKGVLAKILLDIGVFETINS